MFSKSIRSRVIERVNKKIDAAEIELRAGTKKFDDEYQKTLALARDKREASIENLAKDLVDSIIK